jgi:homeobox protein ESX1
LPSLVLLRNSAYVSAMAKDTGKPSATPTGETKSPNAPEAPPRRPKEIGGPSGPEPTRYGDWERNGRVSDF